MESLKVISLCFFFSLFPALITSHEQNCSPKICHRGEPEIRFPFRLEGLQLSQCGYPGFNLSCNYMSKTVLQIPSSGIFIVQEVDYISQSIQIYDPDNCLPGRILYLNLSGSPFTTVYYQNYTFFNCSSSNDHSNNSSLMPISCLGSSTHKVWATNTSGPAEITGCQFVANVKVPVRRPGDSSGLENYLFLTWSDPYCGFCETKGGKCGFNTTNHEIGCVTRQHHGLSRIVIMSLVIGLLPALGLFFLWCLILCIKVYCGGHDVIIVRGGGGGGVRGVSVLHGGSSEDSGDSDGVEHHPVNAEFSTAELSTAILPQLELIEFGLEDFTFSDRDSISLDEIGLEDSTLFEVFPSLNRIGLDDSTIDSYATIVLNDSGRLPKPDDSNCPICLAQYKPNETLKFIPECDHGFHAPCIVKWLHMNATCPVCRKYLLPLMHDH